MRVIEKWSVRGLLRHCTYGFQPVQQAPLTPSHHILVVDDHDDGEGAVAALLAERGFDVGEARDGEGAFEVMISGPEPSAVILDLMTPVRSAPELLYMMQRSSRLSRIPVIVLVDHPLMPDFRHKLSVAHVSKPFDAEALLATLERCIHLRH